MKGYFSIILIVMLACLTACSSGAPRMSVTPPDLGSQLGPVPTVPHITSATNVIDGVDYIAAGAGVTDIPPAIKLDASGTPLSWAMYGFGVFDWQTLESLALSTDAITGQYWVGLAVYSDPGNWEFHGPYTDDCLLPLDSDPVKYLSPEQNLHWVVIETGGSMTLNNSTVETGGTPPGPVFHVPPSGQHTVFDGPATDPYLFFMDDTMYTAEDGAPIVLYTADNEGLPDSYVAWYNGTDWESRDLDSLKQTTHARGFWNGEEARLFAYYYEADAFGHSQYKIGVKANERLELTAWGYAGIYDKYPDVVGFDCQPGSNAWVLMYADRADDQIEMQYHVNGHNGSFGGPVGTAEVIDIAVTVSDDGSDAWAMYIVGRTTPASKLHENHFVKYFDYGNGSWIPEPSDWFTLDEAITLDLHYNSAQEPELLIVSARDYQLTVPPELDVTTTLFQDVSLGTFNGHDWEFTTLLTGTIDDSNKDSGELGVDLGIDAYWAGTDAMVYVTGNGTVTFSGDPEFHYTGGNLATAGTYLARDGESFSPSTDFVAGTGLNYVWAEGPGGMACVYLDTNEVALNTVASCELDQASGNVIYWAP